jgi:hypothetical protein
MHSGRRRYVSLEMWIARHFLGEFEVVAVRRHLLWTTRHTP